MPSRKLIKDRLATRHDIGLGLRALLIFCLPLCFLMSVKNVYAFACGAAITCLLVALIFFKSTFDLAHRQGAGLKNLKANGWLICLLMFSCATVFWTEDKVRGLVIIVQLVAIAGIAIMFEGAPLRASTLPLASLPLKLNLILNAGVFAMQAPGGFMGQQFAGIYDNSNFCATVLFLTSFFLMLEYKASGSRMALFMIACSIMIMIFTGSRAVLLALIIALAANALPHAARRRLYWPTLGLIGVFIYVYLYQAAHDAHALENGMVQTGKDIFTGRQVIWDHVLQLIQDAPWLGYGLGAVPATYGDVHVYDGKSIHNLYLQTWYQTGLVGLILLILTLRQKYMDLTNAGGPAQLAGAYLIGILVIQTFEVDLTQNNFAAALGMWLIITSGGTTVEQARALPGRRRLRSWAEVEWGRGYEERIHRSGTYENSAVIRRMQSAYHQVGKRFGG